MNNNKKTTTTNNNNNGTSSSSQHHDDSLDSFLTTIESKLRGPFSSLDLAKAVTTTALRTTMRRSSQLGAISGNKQGDSNNDRDPAKEYLQNLSSVLKRTNKVIQCRMLIGLLGLNDIKKNNDSSSNNNGATAQQQQQQQYLTPEILHILHKTQVDGDYEDWVRTTSGLIEGVMFRTQNNNNNSNTRESCRSEEATQIIVTTGTGVCNKVESQIKKSGQPYEKPQKKQKQKDRSSSEMDIDDDDNNNNNIGETTQKKAAAITNTTGNKRTRGFTIEKVIPSSSPKSSNTTKLKQAPSSMNGTVEKLKEEVVVPSADSLLPTPDDLNACFAPYRYRLISTPVLNMIIPEFDSNKNNNSNCHFQVNSDADILQIDLRLEAQRAKEHGTGVGGSGSSSKVSSATTANNNNSNNGKNNVNNNNPAKATTKGTFPPGFRPAKLVPTTTSSSAATATGSKRKAGAVSGSSNLFMPKKKKPTNLFNTTTKFRPQPVKTLLRRKGGGAQSLLKSSNTSGSGGAILSKLGGSTGSGVVGGGAAGSTTAAASNMRSRPGGMGTGRFSSNKRDAGRGGTKSSKMKMIDVDDVDILSKQRSTAGIGAKTKMSADKLRASKREQILKRGRTSAPLPPVVAAAAAAATKQKISPSPPRPTASAAAAAAPQNQQDTVLWQSLLRDKSNKMSEDDKARAERFFTTNQSERSGLTSSDGGPVYKMKIHEQRGNDVSTGQEIKETFYLELDYNTGEQKQSRKIKRY
jgi:hypothetical protein